MDTLYLYGYMSFFTFLFRCISPVTPCPNPHNSPPSHCLDARVQVYAKISSGMTRKGRPLSKSIRGTES